jgi:hypothetical protein
VFLDSIAYTTTTYEVTSTLATPAALVIEHARTDATTFDTKPIAETLDLGRFKMSVPARSRATLDVVEKRALRRYHAVTGLTGQAIKAYLADKLLEPATVAVLEDILAKEAQTVALGAQQKALETERKAVRMRMDDARKSLAPLDAQTDASLRARFIAQLSAHEDAMEALDRRERDLATAIEALNTAISAAAIDLGKGKG